MSPNLYTFYPYILLSFHNYNTFSLICQSAEASKNQATFRDSGIPTTPATARNCGIY